jgi:hypothetical protein
MRIDSLGITCAYFLKTNDVKATYAAEFLERSDLVATLKVYAKNWHNKIDEVEKLL